MTFTSSLLTTIFVLFSFVVQERTQIIGQWTWKSYEMEGKVTMLSWDDVLFFNEDGSYEKRCSFDKTEMKTCESGNWSMKGKDLIHINRDRLQNGTILYPVDHKIFRLNSDSLVIKGKEGTKDIICYYIRNK